MWQLYETDKRNSESTSETKDLPPKFNDVLGIIESEWKEEMLEIYQMFQCWRNYSGINLQFIPHAIQHNTLST